MKDATILAGAPGRSTNGQKPLLLILNTVLTVALFPLFGWAARELWTKVDTNGTTLIRVEERQAGVLSTLPRMQTDIRDLSRKIDEATVKLHEADLSNLERLEGLEKAVLELKYNGRSGAKP